MLFKLWFKYKAMKYNKHLRKCGFNGLVEIYHHEGWLRDAPGYGEVEIKFYTKLNSVLFFAKSVNIKHEYFMSCDTEQLLKSAQLAYGFFKKDCDRYYAMNTDEQFALAAIRQDSKAIETIKHPTPNELRLQEMTWNL